MVDVVAEMGLALSDFTGWYGVPRNVEIAYIRNLNNVIEFKVVH